MERFIVCKNALCRLVVDLRLLDVHWHAYYSPQLGGLMAIIRQRLTLRPRYRSGNAISALLDGAVVPQAVRRMVPTPDGDRPLSGPCETVARWALSRAPLRLEGGVAVFCMGSMRK